MKKLLTFLLITCVVILAGCGKSKQDPFAQYRGSSSTTLFVKGERALAHQKYDEAVRYLEALDALYPFGPYSEQGQLDIIYAYYKSGDDASASAAAERYVRLHPRGKHVAYAYYMRGIIGFDAGLTWLQKKVGMNSSDRDISSLQQSFSAFATVAEQYPHSPYANDSLVRMAYIRNLLAKREMTIANFYMERKAYVAAANRAAEVINHYQGSVEVKKALELLVLCYRHLGLTKMEKQSLALLKTNYPNSAEYRYLK